MGRCLSLALAIGLVLSLLGCRTTPVDPKPEEPAPAESSTTDPETTPMTEDEGTPSSSSTRWWEDFGK